MKKSPLLSIFKKELKGFFLSPAAYIVMTLYLVLTGWFFFSTFFLAGRTDLRDFFSLMPIILSLTIPAITMKIFSEEYRSGSYEIIGTLPVTTVDIIGGKYLSSLTFIVIMILPTFAYPLFIGGLGDLDWGPVFGGYLGALLLVASYTAIGLFASSVTKNQIVAFIISAAVCFALSIIDRMLLLFPTVLTGILQYISTAFHFRNIGKGIIDSRDLIYFLSLIFISLYGTWIATREHR